MECEGINNVNTLKITNHCKSMWVSL